MANKRSKQKKAKQNSPKASGQKAGAMSQEMSSPKPIKKKKR